MKITNSNLISVSLFQAIVLFVGAKSFKELLSQTFSSLCKDPVVAVRQSLSKGFHEVNYLLVKFYIILKSL